MDLTHITNITQCTISAAVYIYVSFCIDKMVYTVLELICHRLFDMLTIDIRIDGSLLSPILIVFTNRKSNY